MQPNLYVIAGPNGVGKTTFAKKFLPHYAECRNFINADLIAQGIAPFSPEEASFRSGRVVLKEIESYAEQEEDFGFETTLAGRSYLSRIRKLRANGYRVHIFFLWLPKVDLALLRIKRRVQMGGHNVPARDARRRYGRSAKNFLKLYRALAHEWFLLDNSGSTPLEIAFARDERLTIMREADYANFVEKYGKGE